MRIPVAAAIVTACLLGRMHEPGRRRDRTADVLTGPRVDGSGDDRGPGSGDRDRGAFVDGDVGTPVSVTGTADVVDAALTVRVLGEDGVELAAIVVKASCGDGCRGTFATELSYSSNGVSRERSR